MALPIGEQSGGESETVDFALHFDLSALTPDFGEVNGMRAITQRIRSAVRSNTASKFFPCVDFVSAWKPASAIV